MSRIMMMTSATAALLVSASALAWGWQAGTRLTLVTSDGARIIGVGGVDEGELEITVERDFEGYAVLMVEGPEGTLETFDVVVEAGGNIVVGAGGNYSNLSDSTARAGLGYQLSLDSGSKGTGSVPSKSKPTWVGSASMVASQGVLEALGLVEVASTAESVEEMPDEGQMLNEGVDGSKKE